MAALLGPDQMAALLGPSWKSRQPRMCQYCQRMFSNKFNLKQVICCINLSTLLIHPFQHILNMHTVGKELQCEICQKKVKNKWYLRRHHVTHHGAPLKKWIHFKCLNNIFQFSKVFSLVLVAYEIRKQVIINSAMCSTSIVYSISKNEVYRSSHHSRNYRGWLWGDKC